MRPEEFALNTNQEIQQRIRELRNQRQFVQHVMPKKNKPQFVTLFLGTCIVLMSLVIVSMAAVKYDVFASRPVIVKRPAPTEPVTPQLVVNGDLEQRVAALEKQSQSWSSLFQTWSTRSWLIAVALNENANIAKTIDATHHHNPNPGYITFDENWKLNKAPKTVKLSTADQERIKQHVK